jgi:hypothetical protein
MTHDELIEIIDFLHLDGLMAWMQPALRAVVELHKPFESMQGTACLECSEDEYACLYPCPTIMAIEKELK